MEKQHGFQKVGIKMKRTILGCAFSLLLFLTTSSLEASFAYVANGNSNNVSVIDTSSNTVVATVTVGMSPSGVAITPNGAFAYVANFNSNNVSVIDTSSNTVVATITVGMGP